MSTIQPRRRTIDFWSLPRALSYDFWFRPPSVINGRRQQVSKRLLASLLLLAQCDVARPQDPLDEPLSSAIRQDAVDERSFEGVKIVSNKMSIDLTESSSKDFEFNEKLLRVDGHDPDIIKVDALDPTRLRVRGVKQGVTTMVVTGSSQKYVIEVFVGGDARLLQTILKRKFKDSAIECLALQGGAVLLSGYVTDNQTIRQIVEVAELYAQPVINHMRVGGPQEVQMRVRVIEVQRSKLRQLGIDLQAMTKSAAVASTPSSIAPLTGLANSIGGAPTATLSPSSANAPTFTLGLSGNHFAFDLFSQALVTEGLLKVMSEPILTARSGEAASLKDGGEFPIPVPGGLGTVTIEFREFGVILETLPIVISPSRVKVQVTAEVSDKDTANSITLLGTTVPGLSKRRIQSTVDMNFGDTMVLGGMISTREQGTTLKTPFFGELPMVGAMFRKVQYQQAETELMILITPEFGSSMSPDQVPAGGPGMLTTAPTNRELFGHGILEVPKYSPNCGHECPPNISNRYGTQSPLPGGMIPSGSTAVPKPTMGPTITPLISPPGTETQSIPPSPGRDPSVSRTFKGSSRSQQYQDSLAKKSKDSGKSSDSIQATGFKKPLKSERTSESRSSERKSDEQE